MAEQIIYLDPEDDQISIRDRLARADAGRVLLVLPTSNEPVQDRLGMVLIQRQAARQGIALGLVTTNPGIVAEARDLGLPVFPTEEIGQNRRWRWPWQPAKEQSVLQPPNPTDHGDLKEMYRRTHPRPTWQGWVARLAGLVLFIFVLSFLGVAAIYVAPGAKVVLHPATQDITVTAVVVGDPNVEKADYEAGLVPARLLRVEVSWRGSAATTGTADVPDAPATGSVVFVNQQTEPVNVPAGVIVRTSTGTTIRFRTTESVEAPGASGATAEANIVALDPGPWGNVDANLINQIEGALALQLNVRNLAPTQGGSIRQSKAVTQADLDRLRGQVLQQLFQLAKAEMGNWMTQSEFLAEESLTLYAVMEEDYSRFVGERADSVELEMTVFIQGYVVDSTEGYGVVYTTLAAETPDGYRLLPHSIAPPRRGEVIQAEQDGRVTFLMQGRAQAAAEIDLARITEMIRGQDIGMARAWIRHNIPVQQEPLIQVWPPGFERLPYLPIRITIEIETP